MVNEKASADQIRAVAQRAGMMSLKDGGLEKVKMGLTTLDEVLRVTKIELKA